MKEQFAIQSSYNHHTIIKHARKCTKYKKRVEQKDETIVSNSLYLNNIHVYVCLYSIRSLVAEFNKCSNKIPK